MPISDCDIAPADDAGVLQADGAFRLGLRRFAAEALEPVAAEIDRTGQVPPRAVALLRAQGCLGLRIGTAHRGAGLGLLPYLVALEELSRVHRVFALIADGSSGMVPLAIERAGSEVQRGTWLRGLATGELASAFALTEPGAGSDAAAIATSAVPDGDGWVLDGRKHYINGGHTADVVMVMAVTDRRRRARGGITAFLVGKGTPGFAVSRVETTIGSEAVGLAELSFQACRLPEAAVLGPVGEGFRIAMQSLADGRLGIAFSCIGIADRLVGMMAEHARARSTFGAKLATRQAIQWMVADSATELEAARAMTYATACDLAAGRAVGVRPGMCKLFASEMVGRVADRAVQVFGGMGLVRGFPVERFYRDVRHYRVGEGASEIQRMLIARQVLGLNAAGEVQ